MKTNYSSARREAKSREDLSINTSEYGMYSKIFDRKGSSVDRYLDRGMELPSVDWTKEFVQVGGRFDSCGAWGITPQQGITLEKEGIPADFAGKMLNLLGRADYDFCYLAEVYNEGIVPQKRSEYHACVTGIHRQSLAQKAKATPKSTMRLGWMKYSEFSTYIFKTASKIGECTNYHSFNGIHLYYEDEDGNEYDFSKNIDFLKNPIFANWVAKRPSKNEKDRRRDAKKTIPTIWLKNVPPHLMAVAMRKRDYFVPSHLCNIVTSVGRVFDTGDGRTLIQCLPYSGDRTAKRIFVRQIKKYLSVAKIANKYFVWNPENGFQNHIENASLREAVRLWENRSRRGEPRPLCLNEVRNDRSGTAGFCLTGTKAFLQDRMPFLYNLIRKYSSWSEVPDEIMSTVWDIDFKVFKGYPVP